MTQFLQKKFPQKTFQNALLSWFDANKRDLPFRENQNPYRVWLSEIMLQQTTVAAVVAPYQKFLKRFPSERAVAKASEHDVLTLWQGLGYYSRARNFQKACRQIVDELDGEFPNTAHDLQKLAGIGEYTAAAVASICFNEKVATIDGNVKRVLARIFDFDAEISSATAKVFFRTTADALVSPTRPGDYNQAVMELGATVCRPKSPTCMLCPVGNFCASRGKNPERLPIVKKQSFINKTYNYLLMANDNAVVLRKPHSESLIAGMWELPAFHNSLADPITEWQKLFGKILSKKNIQKFKPIKHSITNKKITAQIYAHPPLSRLPKDFKRVSLTQLKDLPVSTLSRKIISSCAFFPND